MERAVGPDPFDTEELRDLRAEHRRALRAIESWILDRCIQHYGVSDDLKVDPAYAGLVEREVRRYAASLLDETAHLRRDIRNGLVDRETQQAIHRGSFPPSVQPIVQEMRTTKRVDDLAPYGDDLVSKLHGAIFLLLLADVIAGDYSDPRIGAQIDVRR